MKDNMRKRMDSIGANGIHAHTEEVETLIGLATSRPERIFLPPVLFARRVVGALMAP
jgi:hypothetical protein